MHSRWLLDFDEWVLMMKELNVMDEVRVCAHPCQLLHFTLYTPNTPDARTRTRARRGACVVCCTDMHPYAEERRILPHAKWRLLSFGLECVASISAQSTRR